MKIVNVFGKENLAKVYVADIGDNRYIEFVESLQPPFPREEKWVLIISSSVGCSVKCKMCDAGGQYKGRLTASQMFAQIDYMVKNRYPDLHVPAKKFKVQFARMGEPAFNNDVLKVLENMKERYYASGLMPCISTIAPNSTDTFFNELRDIKSRIYQNGKFQLQFSVHSTDEKIRDELMPVAKWSLQDIAEYGSSFIQKGERKVTLNFALIKGVPLDPQVLKKLFSPQYFMIKMTPVNPTYSAVKNQFSSYIAATEVDKQYTIVKSLQDLGFDTLISIGENEENLIGSNCGQYVMRHYVEDTRLSNGYTYITK